MREFLVVYLKGFSMGAADVVPGVSGGTIALIVGIYDRLIRAITALDPRALRSLLRVHDREGRAAARETLEQMDVPFLVALGLGVGTAIVVLSQVMHHFAETYPVPTYAFFFGLIAASAIVLYGQIERITLARIAIALLGAGLAFVISGAAATDVSHAMPMIFLAGAVAICAMILPGVSGAFFLLILGQYEYLTGELGDFLGALVALVGGGPLTPVVDTGTTVAVFGLGAALGLLSMAHVIRRALERYRAATLTFLVSLMVGALRLPFVEVGSGLGETPHGTRAVALVAGVVGAGAVLLVDRYTDDLEYAA